MRDVKFDDSRMTAVKVRNLPRESVTLKFEGIQLAEVVAQIQAVLDEHPSRLTGVEVIHTTRI